MMARFRKDDTGPEIQLRIALRQLGVRFRTYPSLPGTPDLALRHGDVVVFVHGCFWHGCPKHYRQPKRNLGYWIPKLQRNRARDRAASRALREAGWRVATAWECAIRKDSIRVARRIARLAGCDPGGRKHPT